MKASHLKWQEREGSLIRSGKRVEGVSISQLHHRLEHLLMKCQIVQLIQLRANES